MRRKKIHSTGRPIGRPPREIPASFKKYYHMWKPGEVTATDFARLLGISRPPLYTYNMVHEKDSDVLS